MIPSLQTNLLKLIIFYDRFDFIFKEYLQTIFITQIATGKHTVFKHSLFEFKLYMFIIHCCFFIICYYEMMQATVLRNQNKMITIDDMLLNDNNIDMVSYV